jgi:xanthine dehydrogenase large subunit
MGWLTMEELVWNNKGKLMTNGPASYKIPAVADMPLDLRVKLVENRKNPEDTVFHSKAVGEPPFMLGIASWCAIKDAVASLGDYRHQPKIDAPATPERVLWGCEQMRQLQAATVVEAETEGVLLETEVRPSRATPLPRVECLPLWEGACPR